VNVIGRTDFADFPELAMQDIPIKIDSGAYTSSIHSHHIIEIEEDGEKMIEFEILDPSFEQFNVKKFRTKNYKVKAVKSSNGEVEHRFFIKTNIVLFKKEYSIELSLTDRGEMKYPILIGRRFLSKKLLVNTSLKDVSFEFKKAE
jgi:hypothetical protein